MLAAKNDPAQQQAKAAEGTTTTMLDAPKPFLVDIDTMVTSLNGVTPNKMVAKDARKKKNITFAADDAIISDGAGAVVSSNKRVLGGGGPTVVVTKAVMWLITTLGLGHAKQFAVLTFWKAVGAFVGSPMMVKADTRTVEESSKKKAVQKNAPFIAVATNPTSIGSGGDGNTDVPTSPTSVMEAVSFFFEGDANLDASEKWLKSLKQREKNKTVFSKKRISKFCRQFSKRSRNNNKATSRYFETQNA